MKLAEPTNMKSTLSYVKSTSAKVSDTQDIGRLPKPFGMSR